MPRDDGNTPLLLAAYGNRREVVDHLLSRGANPEARNKYGENYLDFYERWDQFGDEVKRMNGAWVRVTEDDDGSASQWWWEIKAPEAFCVFEDGTRLRNHLGLFEQGIASQIPQS